MHTNENSFGLSVIMILRLTLAQTLALVLQ